MWLWGLLVVNHYDFKNDYMLSKFRFIHDSTQNRSSFTLILLHSFIYTL